MPTDRPRLFLAAVAAALLLTGCADDTAADKTPAPSAPSAGADGGAAGGDPTRDRAGAGGGSSKGSDATSDGTSDGTDSDASGGADPGSEPEPDNGGGADPSGAVLEVPVAAEPSVDSLGDLLGDSGAARPLVAAPLPSAASARGRLVGGFPAVLRPVPGSRVETSSVSPADDRLQVALVGSTTQAPAQVLLGYRTRLGRRGLVEQAAAPMAAPGSQVAALQRGRSVVTVTVTREGSRTSYSVVASLHTGRG